MGPMYPRYPSQPIGGGKLPTMVQVGPPDTRYSSGTAAYYQAQIDRQYGRSLGDSGDEVQDEDAEPAWAKNELDVYAELDDVQGSGIFDPPGTHPNIHPDAGVFASRYSLPGYHARERPFAESEVRDITTGRPIRAVPSGAVSLDSAAQVAFIEQGLYGAPRPLVTAASFRPIPSQSIANWMQNPQPVGALSFDNLSLGKTILGAAAIGLVVGALAGMATKKRGA